MKFKVGERYEVCDPTGHMENGNIIEITKVETTHAMYKTIKGVNDGLNVFGKETYFAKCLKRIKKECIVIYHNGNETVAHDKSTGKKAVAKCSPDDTYDFYTGAKLAFERLTQPQPEKPKRYNGKVVCIKTDHWNLTVGKIYKVVDGVLTYDSGLKSGTYIDFEDLQAGFKSKFIEIVE